MDGKRMRIVENPKNMFIELVKQYKDKTQVESIEDLMKAAD